MISCARADRWPENLLEPTQYDRFIRSRFFLNSGKFRKNFPSDPKFLGYIYRSAPEYDWKLIIILLQYLTFFY